MMLPVLSALLACMGALVRPRASLHLEHLALRHQLAVYQQSVPRPHLRVTDRLFWAWLSRLWSGWQHALTFVQPRTVIAWQRRRFRNYWRQLSRSGTPGRPAIAQDVRELIHTMSQANPTWGAPRIVGELRKLGIEVAKSTVEKYRGPMRTPPSSTWKTFLNNHRQDLVSLDFFTVPTVTYKVLFVLLILTHERRRVVHFNVTEHPTRDGPPNRSSTPSRGTKRRGICCAIGTVSTAPRFGNGCGIWGSKKWSSPPGVRGRTPMSNGSSERSAATASTT
jgi:putative transposase